jgi:predicted lipid-binding transport protein (Tim44 family)
MSRLAAWAALGFAALMLAAPAVLAQAGGGSSGFSGGGGGGGGSSGVGGSSGGGDGGGVSLGGFILIVCFFAMFLLVPIVVARRRTKARAARDARVTTASAEAAEDDPAFAATAVKASAGALYVDVQRAWTERDDAALARMLGPDLLVEWRRRLADFERRGWVNQVSISDGPKVEYVGLVNREGAVEDRVTVSITATLRSVVRTTDGAIITRDEDEDEDGELVVCEFWTLARSGDAWRLISIEQEAEGMHHLQAPIVATPSSDARIADESLTELAGADAPPPGIDPSGLIDVEFDGTAHEQALDLSLADPRCAPDVLTIAARRAVEAWAEAVDGDDAALLAVATPQAVRELLHPGGEAGNARVVVRGPQLLRVAITALHAETEPVRMEVEVRLRGPRYVEDRDTAAVLEGDRNRVTTFTERWTFALDPGAATHWQLLGATTPSRPPVG